MKLEPPKHCYLLLAGTQPEHPVSIPPSSTSASSSEPGGSDFPGSSPGASRSSENTPPVGLNRAIQASQAEAFRSPSETPLDTSSRGGSDNAGSQPAEASVPDPPWKSAIGGVATGVPGAGPSSWSGSPPHDSPFSAEPPQKRQAAGDGAHILPASKDNMSRAERRKQVLAKREKRTDALNHLSHRASDMASGYPPMKATADSGNAGDASTQVRGKLEGRSGRLVRGREGGRGGTGRQLHRGRDHAVRAAPSRAASGGPFKDSSSSSNGSSVSYTHLTLPTILRV